MSSTASAVGEGCEPPPQRLPRLELTSTAGATRPTHNVDVYTVNSDSDSEGEQATESAVHKSTSAPLADVGTSQPSPLESSIGSAGADVRMPELARHPLRHVAPDTNDNPGTPDAKPSPARRRLGSTAAAELDAEASVSPVRAALARVEALFGNSSREVKTELAKRTASQEPSHSRSGSEELVAVEPPPALSDEQLRTMSLVIDHARSVFITGGAGTGKSFLLRKIIASLPRSTTFVTATTGIAALNLGGTTLHSFAGCGLVERGADRREVFSRVRARAKVRKNWQSCQVLIIDEVSMLDPWFFDVLDYVARRIRNSPDEPFGGIQLVLSGDFLQLPPVIKAVRQPTVKGATAPTSLNRFFCFESESWLNANPVICVLTKAFRQRDSKFFQMLSEMRMGVVSSMTLTRLQALNSATTVNFVARVSGDAESPPHALTSSGYIAGGQRVQLANEDGTLQNSAFDGYTILRPKRDEVDRENNFYYDQLTTEEVMYVGVHTGQGKFDDKALPLRVRVREGCRVMLIKNFDASLGLVNGSTGYVKGFIDASKGYRCRNEAIAPDDIRQIAVGRGNDHSKRHMLLPIVAFEVRQRDGTMATRDLVVEPQEWKEMQGDTCLSRTVQMPLILAYAITIHKSQGMSLTHVDIDFRNIFETGQSYVALSRCTDLEHTRLHSFNALAVQPNPIALSYYKALDHFFAARQWRRQHVGPHSDLSAGGADRCGRSPTPTGDPVASAEHTMALDDSNDGDDATPTSFTPYGYVTPTRLGLHDEGDETAGGDAVLTPAESPTMQIEALRKRILPATQQADKVQQIVRNQLVNASRVFGGRLVMDVTAFFDLITGNESAAQYQQIFETNGNCMRVPLVVLQKLSEVAAYKLSQCGGNSEGADVVQTAAEAVTDGGAPPHSSELDDLLQASNVAAEALELIERAKVDFSLDVQREGETVPLPPCQESWMQFQDALPLLRDTRVGAAHATVNGGELDFLLNRDPREVPQHAEILRYALFLRQRFGSQSFVLCTNSPTLAAYGLAYNFSVAHIGGSVAGSRR